MEGGSVGNILIKRIAQCTWSVAYVLMLKNHQQFKFKDSWVYLQTPILYKIKFIVVVFINNIR